MEPLPALPGFPHSCLCGREMSCSRGSLCALPRLPTNHVLTETLSLGVSTGGYNNERGEKVIF